MKQEEKQLLLHDLCARLPYGIKGRVNDRIVTLDGVNITDSVVEHDKYLCTDIDKFVPYLFPFSSMTEEQQEMLEDWDMTEPMLDISGTGQIYVSANPRITDWLNAHHFDYRDLIEKSLAIDATGLNIYNKEEHP